MRDLANFEGFLRQYFFFIIELIYNLYGNDISRPYNIEIEDLFPSRCHVVGLWYGSGVLHLLILINKDFNHRLKGVLFEEIAIEFSFDDVEGKCWPFHNGYVVDSVARISFLNLA